MAMKLPVMAAVRAGATVSVTVEDDGPGVPPEALARLGVRL